MSSVRYSENSEKYQHTHTESESFISLIFKKVVIRDTMLFKMKVLPYGFN